MIPAYTLEEVVAAGLAPSVHFLAVRLRRREITGRKIGRQWRMTDQDIADYIKSRANTAQSNVVEPAFGLSAASQRRRAG